MAGGGGSADAQSSLNQLAGQPPSVPSRWDHKVWIRLALAFLPVVAVVVAVLVALAVT